MDFSNLFQASCAVLGVDAEVMGIVANHEENPADHSFGMMPYRGMGETQFPTDNIFSKNGHQVGYYENLGMFHFGGSTHCLIFRPEVKLDFDLHGQEPGLYSNNIMINSRIATFLK